MDKERRRMSRTAGKSIPEKRIKEDTNIRQASEEKCLTDGAT